MSLKLHLTVRYQFERAIQHCDNLVLVHQRAGTGSRGRRRVETSVNRAIVVIAIASWQAVVQDMTRFLLDHSMPGQSDPQYGVARLIHGQVMRVLGSFSTPNAENTRQLLQSVGFDPRPHWTWANGARGSREVVLRPADVEEQLRDWLKVRHAIAHGDEKLPEVNVLQAVRQNQVSSQDGPTIRLYDAKQCIAFIRKLAGVTLAGLESELPKPQ
ncbi:hypothetical protein [Mycobacteroides abscessus]|uniref:hypothetical protein n=1 Tax=Mycobacteroides abscessus TaxID=36809 RepID=UPI000C2583FD|nr:hypothetical protein [Mycobacteroides abscessus]PVB44282.1 hypothetical protein DDJ39_15085 [Mycobacteroides abscessus]